MLKLSRSIARRSTIGRRRCALQISTTATAASGEGCSSSNDERTSFVRTVTRVLVVAGSAMGILLIPSTPDSLVSYADSEVENRDPKRAFSFRDLFKDREPKFLLNDSFRRRVFFNYEKRIRLQSTPEKIFEYFASFQNQDGEVFMLPADLMRAIVPVFPPSESDIIKGGYLRGERHPSDLHCAPSTFFMLFDTNNDGFISFAEYIFFVTLLSIPESSFSAAFKMFDLDNNGEIDMEEFKKVMALMRSSNRQGSTHRNGLRTGMKVGRSIDNSGLIEYFFGEDGKGCLKHDKFVQFLKDLHDEIVRLEFAHYDCKSSGTIPAKDFALSLVASADINHIKKLLNRVDEIDHHQHFKDIRISLEEFKAFAELRRKLLPLTVAMFSYGKVNGQLTKQDFQRASSHVCEVDLSDNMIDIIFHVFDVNRDGSLSVEEFIRALQRRESDLLQQNVTGLFGLLSCWLNCAKSCSFHRIAS